MRTDTQNGRWRPRAALLALLGAWPLLAAAAPATAPGTDATAPWIMDNGVVRLTVTPTLGGRVLGFQRSGGPNLIKVGDAVQRQPLPTVSAAANDIPYFGHDVWVGPQSAWWQHQDANPARRAAHANWPPDPYLSFATTTVVARAPQRLQLRGVDSPVSGVRLRKTFALSPQRADSVLLQVQAQNVRKTAVAWDLWFNTRVSAATRVLVPVAAAADIRVQPSDGAGYAPPQYVVQDGLMTLAAAPPGSAGQRRTARQAAAAAVGRLDRRLLRRSGLGDPLRPPAACAHPSRAGPGRVLPGCVGFRSGRRPAGNGSARAVPDPGPGSDHAGRGAMDVAGLRRRRRPGAAAQFPVPARRSAGVEGGVRDALGRLLNPQADRAALVRGGKQGRDGVTAFRPGDDLAPKAHKRGPAGWSQAASRRRAA